MPSIAPFITHYDSASQLYASYGQQDGNGVTALNGLSNVVSLLPGNNVYISTIGQGIQINSTGGASGVVDLTLNGAGPGISSTVNFRAGSNMALHFSTVSNTIVFDAALAAPGVTSLNSETGAISLVAGTNVTISNAGSNITINASGGGGSASLPTAVSLTNAGNFELFPGSNVSYTWSNVIPTTGYYLFNTVCSANAVGVVQPNIGEIATLIFNNGSSNFYFASMPIGSSGLGAGPVYSSVSWIALMTAGQQITAKVQSVSGASPNDYLISFLYTKWQFMSSN